MKQVGYRFTFNTLTDVLSTLNWKIRHHQASESALAYCGFFRRSQMLYLYETLIAVYLDLCNRTCKLVLLYGEILKRVGVELFFKPKLLNEFLLAF